MSIGYYQIGKNRVAAIDENCEFPPLNQALKQPNGLLAIGGNLSSSRLLNAYQNGIFPWFNVNEPICWYSPDPRMVLFPNEINIQPSLKKVLKKQDFTITFNQAFLQTITACSQTPRPGQQGTWLTPEMISAYHELHQLGFAISCEAWQKGQLVGGCYGVKIGRMFFGESMFHTVSYASKVAFVHLVEWLNDHQIKMIDCQMKTPLLTSFGGREITRATFAQTLAELID